MATKKATKTTTKRAAKSVNVIDFAKEFFDEDSLVMQHNRADSKDEPGFWEFISSNGTKLYVYGASEDPDEFEETEVLESLSPSKCKTSDNYSLNLRVDFSKVV